MPAVCFTGSVCRGTEDTEISCDHCEGLFHLKCVGLRSIPCRWQCSSCAAAGDDTGSSQLEASPNRQGGPAAAKARALQTLQERHALQSSAHLGPAAPSHGGQAQHAPHATHAAHTPHAHHAPHVATAPGPAAPQGGHFSHAQLAATAAAERAQLQQQRAQPPHGQQPQVQFNGVPQQAVVAQQFQPQQPLQHVPAQQWQQGGQQQQEQPNWTGEEQQQQGPVQQGQQGQQQYWQGQQQRPQQLHGQQQQWVGAQQQQWQGAQQQQHWQQQHGQPGPGNGWQAQAPSPHAHAQNLHCMQPPTTHPVWATGPIPDVNWGSGGARQQSNPVQQQTAWGGEGGTWH